MFDMAFGCHNFSQNDKSENFRIADLTFSLESFIMCIFQRLSFNFYPTSIEPPRLKVLEVPEFADCALRFD